MTKRRDWPDSWPDAVFFAIGAVIGVGLAVLGSLLVPLRPALTVPIACASGVIFGFLGVAFREDMVLFLPPWN